MDKSHELILTKEEKRKMDIASCRCCLLGLKDCKNCAFNFSLPIIEKEKRERTLDQLDQIILTFNRLDRVLESLC